MTTEKFIGSAQRASRRSTQSATLTDVAKIAQVSQQTVSRAIRSPLLVSETTLQRVKWAIEATGYLPNLTASNLASNRSMSVAAIIPVISASIFADAVDELECILAASGYQLFLGATGYRLDHEEELIRTFLGRRPDGFFIVGTNHTPAARSLLQRARVPIVESWEMTEEPIDYLVAYSNWDSIKAIVEYAVDQGYKRPTFAGTFTAGDSRSISRRKSFESSVNALLPDQPIRIISSDSQAIDMGVGKRLLHISLSQHPETDVLMFSSDNFASGALLECNRLGIDVPNTLAITGFGDFEIARHLVPGLTTVSIPNRTIGMRAGEVLVQAMTGTKVEHRSLDVGFSVVARGSA